MSLASELAIQDDHAWPGACTRFSLPNGVATLGDGSIVVVEGGGNRLVRLSPNGERVLRAVGGLGLGKYRFREPVGVSVWGEMVFVSDWHNHRVVVYDAELTYVDEFGIPNRAEVTPSLKSLVRYLSFRGSYIPSHFDGKTSESQLAGQHYSFLLGVQAICYWLLRPMGYGPMGIRRSVPMNKPNGIAFWPDRVVVTQKNSRKVAVVARWRGVDVAAGLMEAKVNASAFGRLGNACVCGDMLVVCDESGGLIWVFDKFGNLVRTIVGQDSGNGSFSPFGCVSGPEGLLLACAIGTIQIFDVRSGRLVAIRHVGGELHGIAWQSKNRRILVVDRLSGQLHSYHLNVSH